MRVQIVDPPAYTPPYDRSLCAALARAGAEVELVTSRFAHGAVPAPDGYAVREEFYRRSAGRGGRLRRPLRAAEHLGDMLRYRRRATADVLHFQWLTAPSVDSMLLPSGHPRVLTPHGWLRREAFGARPRRGLLRTFERMDALVALSEYGARRLREEARVPTEKVRVIPHGALDYLTRMPQQAPLPGELPDSQAPVILFFGLLRPYKGADVLLDAFRDLEGAELWIVGRPFGADLEALHDAAARARGQVRFVLRFVEEEEVAALFRRADVVALPYRDAEQSGVLYTALAFGKPLVMSDVGGFGEVAALGAGRIVPPGDAAGLAVVLDELLRDPGERERLAAAARRAAAGPYSWDEVARRTLALYRELLER